MESHASTERAENLLMKGVPALVMLVKETKEIEENIKKIQWIIVNAYPNVNEDHV